jgi:hypothetical protein
VVPVVAAPVRAVPAQAVPAAAAITNAVSMPDQTRMHVG